MKNIAEFERSDKVMEMLNKKEEHPPIRNEDSIQAKEIEDILAQKEETQATIDCTKEVASMDYKNYSTVTPKYDIYKYLQTAAFIPQSTLQNDHGYWTNRDPMVMLSVEESDKKPKKEH